MKVIWAGSHVPENPPYPWIPAVRVRFAFSEESADDFVKANWSSYRNDEWSQDFIAADQTACAEWALRVLDQMTEGLRMLNPKKGYGLWKHGRAGGWCGLNYSEYEGTREQAEEARRVMERERPELRYSVETFDREREPEADTRHVTRAMRDCLKFVSTGGDPYLPHSLGGKFSQGTVRRLIDQGLLMFEPQLVIKYRVTVAGRAALKQKAVP